VRGNYTVAAGARPVQAVHDVYGVLPGGVATTETVPETISFKSFFHSGNDIVYLNITDVVAEQGAFKFPRPFEQGMWATNGLCVGDTAPADVSFSTLDATGGLAPPQPLTPEGTYCVATRPIPADQGDSTLLQTRIATLPEIVTSSQTFMPPVERSPIIYQVVLDLEIPVADRCMEAIQNIESILQRQFARADVSVHQLPTINLAADPSAPCAQNNDRRLAATQMAQAVKQLVTTLPGTHHQYHLLYFNNLDAPQPPGLKNSIRDLVNAFSAPPAGLDLRIFWWLFAPLTVELTSTELTWWAYWVWEAADMNFEMKMADYVNQHLPYTTQTHDQFEPVPLLTEANLAIYEGAQIKICYASPPVQAHALLPSPHDILTPSWKITADDPPSYLVQLNNQVVADGSSFVPVQATVNYQICTRYCTNHPYVTTNGFGELSWTDSFACASESP
jgi:hypothetical protein